MLPLCKFYRYLIYRLYHFRDDTPVINVIVTLTIVHLFIILNILFVIDEFTIFKVWPNFATFDSLLFIILFGILNYLLFYNKKKWTSYDNEFKDETSQQRRRGLIFVLSYLIGTIVLSFIFLIYLSH